MLIYWCLLFRLVFFSLGLLHQSERIIRRSHKGSVWHCWSLRCRTGNCYFIFLSHWQKLSWKMGFKWDAVLVFHFVTQAPYSVYSCVVNSRTVWPELPNFTQIGWWGVNGTSIELHAVRFCHDFQIHHTVVWLAPLTVDLVVRHGLTFGLFSNLKGNRHPFPILPMYHTILLSKALY